jgi:hypothetical protein
MLHRPGDPVGGSDQDHIEAAAAAIGHHLIKTKAARLDAADPIRVLLDDLKAALGGHLAKVEELCSRVLI